MPLLILILLTLLLTTAIWFDLFPILRGPTEWRWPLLEETTAAPPDISLYALTLLIALIGWYLLGRWLHGQERRRNIHLALLSLFILITAVQLAQLRLYTPNPLAIQFERLASVQASGYFTVSQNITNINDFLWQYPPEMPYLYENAHPRTKPPAIVLTYWGAEQLLERIPPLADWLGRTGRSIRCDNLWLASLPNAGLAANLLIGLLTPLISALAIWPAYQLGNRWHGREAAWLSAGLIAFMPGRLIFTPQMDTVYPLFTLAALLAIDTAARNRTLLPALWSGLILSIATFFSPTNGISGLLVGLYLLSYVGRACWAYSKPRPFFICLLRQRTLWLQMVMLALGSASVWVLFYVTHRINPIDVYQAGVPARLDLFFRSYWLWLPGNTYDFALFTGLAVFLLAIPLRKTEWAPQAISFWSIFTLLLFSGVLRGEVGRIWLMMAPIPAVIAATHLIQRQHQKPFFSLPIPLTTLLLLTAVASNSWAMGSRLLVTKLEWPAVQPRQITTTPPDMSHTLNTPIGDDITLTGYDFVSSENGENENALLTLHWQTTTQHQTPYTVYIHVLDTTNTIITQRDIMPQDGRLPTTCWHPQEHITDPHPLDLTPLPPGQYQLRLGLYNQATATPLGQPILLPPFTHP